MKAYRIRIYPTLKQKKILREWFGVYRWTYNRCLESVNENKKNLTLKYLRSRFVNNENFETENVWVKKYAYDLRYEAVRDMIKNYNSNFKKLVKQKRPFVLKYKCKRDTQSIYVHSKHWNKPKNFFGPVFAVKKMKSSEPLPAKLFSDGRLLKTKTNEYYITISRPKETRECKGKEKVIAIDPGERTFATGYSPSGDILEYGKDSVSKLAQIKGRINSITSYIARHTNDKSIRHRKKYRLTRLKWKKYEKIDHLVLELHKKLAKYLLDNYSTIIIPKLNFHKFKNKRRRARLSLLAHCKFVDRLVLKSQEYPGSKVIVAKEDYTSITCSRCGNLNDHTKSKTFLCSGCGYSIDRDINGARNILLKFYGGMNISSCSRTSLV